MFGFFRNYDLKFKAATAYTKAAEQSRLPVFYKEYAVPDTIDGRFDLLVIHSFCLFYVLKNGKKAEQNFAQAIFDSVFMDMDRSLREAGVGDLGVPKHIKRMTTGLNGRCHAYGEGVDDENPITLCKALNRNLFATADVCEADLVRMADYIRGQIAYLAKLGTEAIMSGEFEFASPEDIFAPEKQAA